MSERKIESEFKRIDDDFVEVRTVISETMSNKEFFNHWIGLTAKREQTKLQLNQGESAMENLRKQLEIQNEHINNLEKEAQECNARAGSSSK